MKSEHTKHFCIPKYDDCLHEKRMCIWHFLENEGGKAVGSRNKIDSIFLSIKRKLEFGRFLFATETIAVS